VWTVLHLLAPKNGISFSRHFSTNLFYNLRNILNHPGKMSVFKGNNSNLKYMEKFLVSFFGADFVRIGEINADMPPHFRVQ
jgi:hypothetical protein